MATLLSKDASVRVLSPKQSDYHAARNRVDRPSNQTANSTNLRRCERCPKMLRPEKAQHYNAKYCDLCAPSRGPVRKQSAVERRTYMRLYMREYRLRHPGLSTRYVRGHRAAKRAALLSATP